MLIKINSQLYVLRRNIEIIKINRKAKEKRRTGIINKNIIRRRISKITVNLRRGEIKTRIWRIYETKIRRGRKKREGKIKNSGITEKKIRRRRRKRKN